MHALRNPAPVGYILPFAASRGLVSRPINAPRMMGSFGPMNVPRGGERTPAELLAEVAEAFAEFKSDQEQAINDINGQIAALKIGGAGGEDFDTAGLGVSAGARKARNALAKFGRSGKPEDLVNGLTVNNAMSTDSGPDGGYITGDEIAGEIMRVQRNSSAMRRIAKVVTTRSGNFKQPVSLNNAASGWVGERESRTETTAPKLALVDVPAGEIYANPAITQTLLDDALYDAGGWLSDEIAEAFTSQEGAAFITGDGINKPRGLLSYTVVSTDDASRAFGDLQYVASGVSGAISDGANNGGDALINMVYKLKAKYRANANWLMNSKTAGEVRKLKDDYGRYLWQDSLAAGQPPLLLGYPVEFDEDMSDIGVNAYPIGFGDFQRGYLITDRAGVRLLRDPYTNKPYVMFYATKRVGGGLIDSNAIKLLKLASS